MKTADFIPLILLELNSGNKYGLEITKSIEKRSSGRIVIKQPTLYSILKKLEKSKFISSYWSDSEIGGKRHYYKITETGKIQAATFPNYNEVMRRLLEKEESSTIKQNPTSRHVTYIAQEKKMDEVEQLSILDALAGVNNSPLEIETEVFTMPEKEEATPAPTPIETPLPSEEVFKMDNIDNTTTAELNKHNSSMLKNSTSQNEENFASSNKVNRFTEKPETKITDEYKEQLRSMYELTKQKYLESDNIINNEDYQSIKYVDYVDFKKNQEYIYSKKTARAMSLKVLSTCIYLLFAILLTTISVRFTPDVFVYCIALTISILALLLYPSLYLFYYQKLRLRWEEKPFKHNLSKSIIIAISAFIIVIVLSLLLNITIMHLSFKEVFKINNFANFYTPLILASTLFADICFSYIYLSKYAK